MPLSTSHPNELRALIVGEFNPWTTTAPAERKSAMRSARRARTAYPPKRTESAIVVASPVTTMVLEVRGTGGTEGRAARVTLSAVSQRSCSPATVIALEVRAREDARAERLA